MHRGGNWYDLVRNIHEESIRFPGNLPLFSLNVLHFENKHFLWWKMREFIPFFWWKVFLQQLETRGLHPVEKKNIVELHVKALESTKTGSCLSLVGWVTQPIAWYFCAPAYKYISDLIYTYKHMCIYIHTYIYYVNIDISFSRSLIITRGSIYSLIISAICQWK